MPAPTIFDGTGDARTGGGSTVRPRGDGAVGETRARARARAALGRAINARGNRREWVCRVGRVGLVASANRSRSTSTVLGNSARNSAVTGNDARNGSVGRTAGLVGAGAVTVAGGVVIPDETGHKLAAGDVQVVA